MRAQRNAQKHVLWNLTHVLSLEQMKASSLVRISVYSQDSLRAIPEIIHVFLMGPDLAGPLDNSLCSDLSHDCKTDNTPDR